MGELQSLGADPICNIVAFALGADIVALLTTSRCASAKACRLLPGSTRDHVVLKFKIQICSFGRALCVSLPCLCLVAVAHIALSNG